MHAEHLGNGFALRVRLVSPSRESMVRNVTKEESASAPRHPIPRLAGGGTTKPTEPQPPAGAQPTPTVSCVPVLQWRNSTTGPELAAYRRRS